MREIENARISSTFLGIEDHGVMSFTLFLDYGGSGQGFGQYCLDEPVKIDGKFIRRKGTALGCDCILQILITLGVDSWEKLPGTYVKADHDSAKIYRIAPILGDKWFDVEEFFKDKS